MKKAQMGTIVIMILVIIVAIALFALGGKIFTNYDSKGVIEACKLSVLAQTNTEALGSSPLSLECERRYVDIYKDKVEAGNAPDKTSKINLYLKSGKTKSFRELDDEIVNHVVAEEMKNCWYQFGEAKIEVFPNNEPTFEVLGVGEDEICFTCSEIKFIDIYGEEFSGLLDYARLNKVPEKEYTYWEYLNQKSLSEYNIDTYINVEGKSDIEDLWNDKPFLFNSEKTYSVIFYKDFDQSILGTKTDEKINSATGDDAGGKSAYYVLVVPTENLDDICEVQAG